MLPEASEKEKAINGSGLMRERCLAILHCANGQKITWIVNALFNDQYLDRAVSQGLYP